MDVKKKKRDFVKTVVEYLSTKKQSNVVKKQSLRFHNNVVSKFMLVSYIC